MHLDDLHSSAYAGMSLVEHETHRPTCQEKATTTPIPSLGVIMGI